MQLHEKYKSQGLEIVGFPCNQFGGQEPGTAQEIADFVSTFNVAFPLTEKVEVNGDNSHEVFTFLKNHAPNTGLLPLAAIKWNFTKFLIDKSGKELLRFEPATPAIDLSPKIEEFLARDAPKL